MWTENDQMNHNNHAIHSCTVDLGAGLSTLICNFLQRKVTKGEKGFLVGRIRKDSWSDAMNE